MLSERVANELSVKLEEETVGHITSSIYCPCSLLALKYQRLVSNCILKIAPHFHTLGQTRL